ncbi:MAG: flavodoxin family protein [Permianibacter sp.]
MELLKHMTLTHWLLVVIVIVALAALGAVVAVTTIESRQARQVGELEPYAKPDPILQSRAAVVYFSRSGNTALAARHVAKRLNANLYPLTVPEYALGVNGLANSAFDAKARRDDPSKLPEITPRTIDLTPFDTVWLGSPIWFYSPAPPIWAFIEHNRFDGKHVVLFNTFNSNFGDDQIAAFQAKVMAHGARSFEHRHVLRGRMMQQLTPEEMLKAIDDEWLGPQTKP